MADGLISQRDILGLWKVAMKYPEREREDCLQEARIAYWKASLRWQPGMASLRTYAMHRARGAMIDWLRKSDDRPRGMQIAEKSTLLLGLLDEEEQQFEDMRPTPEQAYIIDQWERMNEDCSSRRRRKHRQ